MKIAACMIVKNEERMILDCLNSLVGFVDVVVVQDTGSTDATPAIVEEWAREHPDIDVVTGEEAWKNDFSHHRNAAFKMVPADVDWVLIIDADERLAWYNNGTHNLVDQHGRRFSEEEMPKYAPAFFRKFLEKDATVSTHDGLSALVKDIKVGGNTYVFNNNPRLFRRWSKLYKGKKKRPGVRYKGTVHNRPDFRGPLLIPPLLGLNHLGYDNKLVDMEAKHSQRIPMMQARLDAKPPDLHMWFFLAEQYGMLGDYSKCMAHARMYIALKDKIGKTFNSSVYYLASRTALELGEIEEALGYCEEGLKATPDDIDLQHTLADIGGMLGRDDVLVRGAEGYLRAAQKGPAAFLDRMVFTHADKVRQLCKYRAALGHLRIGIRMMHQVLGELPEIEPVLRQKILDDMSGLVRYPGLESLLDYMPLGLGLMKGGERAA